MLWEERSSIDFHRDTPGCTASTSEREWLISGATQDAKHCGSAAIAAAEKRATQLRRTPSGTDHDSVTLDGTTVSVVGGGVGFRFTYLCLPDTIDRRGRKGGER